MEIKNLSENLLDQLFDCFFEAFANYYVPMPTDRDFYMQRWTAAKVDFGLSYGAFEDGRMIGFIVHAIDAREGQLIAFNSGTGVRPAYRGKGIVGAIYAFALEDLKSKGIHKSRLEVITANEFAIKSYERQGFAVRRRFHCFFGEVVLPKALDFSLQQIALAAMPWDSLPNQDGYSWDNQAATLRNGHFDCYYVLKDGQPESYFIIKAALGYVAQWDVLAEGEDNWARLFAAMQSISKQIRINNVEPRFAEKLRQIEAFGLKPTVDQFEMDLDIP